MRIDKNLISMLFISSNLFVLNAATTMPDTNPIPSKYSLSNLQNTKEIRELKATVESQAKDIDLLKADVQKLKEQAVGKKDPQVPPQIAPEPENIDAYAILSQIKQELYPSMPRPFWGLRRLARDELQELEYQLIGSNPDDIFSEQNVKQLLNWTKALQLVKISIPDSLKKDFTARVANMVRARPNYEQFIAAYKNDANDKNRATELMERLHGICSMLRHILKIEVPNNPIFAPEAYPNRDADIKMIDKAIQDINQVLPPNWNKLGV